MQQRHELCITKLSLSVFVYAIGLTVRLGS